MYKGSEDNLFDEKAEREKIFGVLIEIDGERIYTKYMTLSKMNYF